MLYLKEMKSNLPRNMEARRSDLNQTLAAMIVCLKLYTCTVKLSYLELDGTI